MHNAKIENTRMDAWYSRLKIIYQKQNTQQYISIATSFITEFISITISNLALWFIPQATEYTFTTFFEIPTLEWYIILLMVCNVLSWCSFVVLYIFELRRELWLVRTFDYSKRYNSVHLVKYKKDYPELFILLERFNYRYYILYRIVKWILLCNIVCSCVIIMYSGYSGYKTITSLFTNFWICLTKVGKGLDIGKNSITRSIGYSYFNTQNLSYNRIDARIKKHISNSNLQHNSQNNSQDNCSNGNGNLSVPNSRLHSRKNSIINSANGSANGSTNGSANGSANVSLNASMNGSTGNDIQSVQRIIPIINIPVVNIPVVNIDEIDFMADIDIDVDADIEIRGDIEK